MEVQARCMKSAAEVWCAVIWYLVWYDAGKDVLQSEFTVMENSQCVSLLNAKKQVCQQQLHNSCQHFLAPRQDGVIQVCFVICFWFHLDYG